MFPQFVFDDCAKSTRTSPQLVFLYFFIIIFFNTSCFSYTHEKYVC